MAAVLPDDVIEEILARLPAKSVLRCRCLSRGWLATISSEGFADRHRRLASRRHVGPMILFLQDSRSGEAVPKVHAWSPEHRGGRTLMEVPRALRRLHRCPRSRSDEDAARLGINRRFGDGKDNLVPRLATQQCRGLLILEATGAGMHLLFNPSTRQTAALPEGRPMACRRRHVGPDSSSCRGGYASFGIGYDTSINKHKVIRIYYRGCDDVSDNNPNIPRGSAGSCEVYVVNSTAMGFWRPVAGPTAGWVNRKETSVFAQGHVHWLAKSKPESQSSTTQDMFITSFSVGDETFGTMQLPLLEPDMADTEERNGNGLALTELGGRLCLFSTECNKIFYPAHPHGYRVWLLRERDGEHETSSTSCWEWDLHCRIDVGRLPREIANVACIGGVIRPLSLIDNGRRIVLIQARHPLARAPSFKLLAYDPATGDVENLPSGLVSNKLMILRHAASYEESISYLGQQHVDIIFAMSLVLRKLSIRTLAMLKCVSRSWRAMIESDDFRRTRLNMSPFGYIF